MTQVTRAFGKGESIITLNEIVLRLIAKISESASHEFKDKSKVITTNSSGVNKSEEIFEENTLNAHIQLIQNLADITWPYFKDEIGSMSVKMNYVYKRTEQVLNADAITFRTVLYKKKLDEVRINMDNDEKYFYWVNKIFWPGTKLRMARILFRNLNAFLQTSSYLADTSLPTRTKDKKNKKEEEEDAEDGNIVTVTDLDLNNEGKI
jgi:hypothetical protein